MALAINLVQGALPVSGSTGQPATFNASLVFNLPPGGGPVRFEVSDAANNASSALDLAVAPPATVVPQQRITISSPAPGTQVGSPVTVTGNAANFPSDGNLDYRVVDAANRQIGSGAFPVSGRPGQAATFVAALAFTPPPNGGSVYVEISDRAAGGAVLASSAVTLQVAPQPVPPTATPVAPQPTVPPVAQTLQITSPVSGTVVGEPFSIQGTTTAYPNDGNLFYRVLNEQGRGDWLRNVQRPGGHRASRRSSLQQLRTKRLRREQPSACNCSTATTAAGLWAHKPKHATITIRARTRSPR